MCFIKYVLRIPLRYDDDTLAIGDYAMHGEEAYVFGEGNPGFVKHHLRGTEHGGVLVGQDAEGIILGKTPDVEGVEKDGCSNDKGEVEIKKD